MTLWFRGIRIARLRQCWRSRADQEHKNGRGNYLMEFTALTLSANIGDYRDRAIQASKLPSLNQENCGSRAS
jgi:hypothetical protein